MTIKDKKKRLIEWTEDFPEGKVEEYRALVEEGLAKDWNEAYYAKGYSSYGGNPAYPCDWEEALRCIKILAERTEEPQYFNTLGYIYYYGRCNNRVPQYEEAFKCFSVGHACGLFESTYKLADMFQHGYGVPKNAKACSSLIHSIYDETLAIFTEGHFEGKFADVALRMGGLYENGIGLEKSPEDAYGFYLQARYAIDQRMKTLDYYGDGKVKKSISDSLDRVRVTLDPDYFSDSVTFPVPLMIGDLLSNCEGLNVSYGTEKGRAYLEAEAFQTDDAPCQALVTVPQMNYCRLTGKVRMYIEDHRSLVRSSSNPMHAFVTGIHYNEEDDTWEFRCSDQPVILFECSGFTFEG